ncbi:MAG: aspartate-semialdehyde dehydrogenase [Verrucomicrobia bacterium]|nr:aspartate-semialdehyde dehydrogenase [Verrucomicrobiota bacterium]MBU4291694.1 aspartate-semialdehyde dehydrogenase [Verrucomicrobiota bacterium]MBU4428104.1 aspartate-semialdehyde dehydrogenase [Verrucomicrobiota bacterium]MCG2680423.1 aspartate-semialdehyde dehydrogenase [Kiritimatiellia bacterium]
MKKYRVGVVGIGAVGAEMIRVLRQRDFPCEEIRVLARKERDEVVDGETFHVVPATPEAFQGLNFAFFAGTEGAKGASQQLGWQAVEKGVIVIDNGDDFRMDSRVPLVIPEVNAPALAKHMGFISNPNCSTIIALMALAPLYRVARIRRFIASTYQAVSGTGRNAILELEQQVKNYVAGKPLEHMAYPHQIAFNVIPKIGGLKSDAGGHTSEEVKMRNETRKIFEDKKIRVCATCVRVPVINGHSEALNIEFDRPMDPAEARDIFSRAPGVVVFDAIERDEYPMPINVSGQDNVFVGRIRADESVKNGLSLFVCGDNIRKGAATNAVQIAEKLIEKG